MRILERADLISEARGRLVDRIRSAADERGRVTMGYQGGHLTEEVFWVREIGLWASFRDVGGRHWNGFGLDNPFEGSDNVAIVVEINPPKAGIDRSVGGIFGADKQGGVYLLHRGQVRGGRPGIGKTNFLRYLKGRWPLLEVEDGDRTSTVIPISRLESDRFLGHLESFVAHVRGFKTAVTSGKWQELDSPDDIQPVEFNPEFSGTKKQPQREALEAECNHGVVVRRLVEELENRGFAAGNDGARDAFVPDGDGGVRWLFEAKTGTSKQAIYTALGQLVFHGDENTEQVAVLPTEIPAELERRIRKRGFEVLKYRWSGDRPVFHDLDELLWP